jgi:hypothetical protein
VIETIVDGLDQPEGVCWDPAAVALVDSGLRGAPLHYPETSAADR